MCVCVCHDSWQAQSCRPVCAMSPECACVCVCAMNHVRVCHDSWQAKSRRPVCAMSHECVCVCVCYESCTCVQLFMASQKSQTYVC